MLYIRIRPHIRTMFTALLIVGAFTALLFRPSAVAGGISRGLSLCGDVIIPSLFPFLILGGFIARCGITDTIGRWLDQPTRLLFGLPGCCAAGIVLSWIGGYPSGATVIAALRRSGQLSSEDGRRMLSFCVCAGPGFLINTVGARLMGNAAFGIVLFAAHTASALLMGILATPPQARRRPPSPVLHDRPRPRVAVAMVESVTAACSSMLSMCGFVLLFAAVLALWDSVSPTADTAVSTLLACVLEVSCGCIAASSMHTAAPLLIGFAVGFGGLSIHCQLAGILRGTNTLTPSFFLVRLAHGLLTAITTVLLWYSIPLSSPVFSPSVTPVIRPVFGHVGMSAFLLILCGIWLLSVDKTPPHSYN